MTWHWVIIGLQLGFAFVVGLVVPALFNLQTAEKKIHALKETVDGMDALDDALGELKGFT